jgi:hypothetical protein
MPPKRILMTSDTVGGVWTLALASTLAEYSIDVHLATMGPRPSQFHKRQLERLSNVHLHESNYRLEWMEDPWDDILCAGDWLLGLESQFKPDIVGARWSRLMGLLEREHASRFTMLLIHRLIFPSMQNRALLPTFPLPAIGCQIAKPESTNFWFGRRSLRRNVDFFWREAVGKTNRCQKIYDLSDTCSQKTITPSIPPRSQSLTSAARAWLDSGSRLRPQCLR